MSENVFVHEKIFSLSEIIFASLCVVHVIYTLYARKTNCEEFN